MTVGSSGPECANSTKKDHRISGTPSTWHTWFLHARSRADDEAGLPVWARAGMHEQGAGLSIAGTRHTHSHVHLAPTEACIQRARALTRDCCGTRRRRTFAPRGPSGVPLSPRVQVQARLKKRGTQIKAMVLATANRQRRDQRTARGAGRRRRNKRTKEQTNRSGRKERTRTRKRKTMHVRDVGDEDPSLSLSSWSAPCEGALRLTHNVRAR